MKKVIKQLQHRTDLGEKYKRDYPLTNLAVCGNCDYKDLLIGFAFHYDWEDNSCVRLECPKCKSRYICEFEEQP
jgi:hypothetical protein